VTTRKIGSSCTYALRHFYAGALIAGVASVKVVRTRLGHASAVITLNT
jgi:integrase